MECEVEVFSRVTGFMRPVQAWNKGKTEEFKDRKRYKTSGFMYGQDKDTTYNEGDCSCRA